MDDTTSDSPESRSSSTESKPTVRVKLSALSVFINKVLLQLQSGRLNPGDLLSIDLTPKANLLDLFALGRLLAFLQALRDSVQVESRIVFPIRRRSRNLEKLGFFKYCKDNRIECEFSQLELFTGSDENTEPHETRLKGKSYWDCLIPLTKHPVGTLRSEQEIGEKVNSLIQEISRELLNSITRQGVGHKALTSEVSRLMNGMLRELVSNTMTHSKSTHFLYALTLSRETNLEFRAHRSNIFPTSGQDKYEFLVMDLGQGILPRVMEILTYGEDKRLDDKYFKLEKWDDSRYLSKHKEESLLTNIFRGDLVIRKGRKSEGLYELGQALSWFGGTLYLFTGRTEMQITSSDSEELGLTSRLLRNPYYLPGVIVSGILPSQQTKTATIRQIANKAERVVKKCEFRRLKRLPNGLFGGFSAGKIRRRSELDAEAIVTHYNAALREQSSAEFFWDLNLKMSDNIDVDFIDSLIQELCKRIDEVEPTESRNFFKLIFTNVPRNVINALKKRNCSSFLMLKESFCLMLDEADEPHLLGIPRVSRNVFDVDDALKLIFYRGSITKQELSSDLGVSDVALDYLQKLLTADKGSLFSWSLKDEHVTFEAHDVIGALSQLRKKRFEDLENAVMYEGKNTVFMLRNNTYVDRIIDFCLLWSDNDCLVDCAKLLLLQCGFPLVDSIVAFMNNGDRLAAAIQRFTGIPNLIIADPHNSSSWTNVDIEGEFVLVVDALYDGDNTDGYIRNFINGTGSRRTPKKIIAFCDFRTQSVGRNTSGLGPELENLEIVSVPIPKGLKTPHAVNACNLHSGVTVLRNFHNYIYSKPKGLEFVSSTAVTKDSISAVALNSQTDGESWKAYRYSPIELSTEFWQNVSTWRVIDTERTGREVRNVLYYENNEKLVENSRTRRAVIEFVSEFVKNVLGLQVDVILHPAHPVGSFLAQMVSAQLSRPPLVFPLTQRSYGGQIEVTQGDYDYYHGVIKGLRETRGRDELNCLIVDDSVLSGSSVFTMLGVAARLDLRVNGILVLLSRLTSEVSKALSAMPLSFASLYRLHMPILTDDQSPDTKLKRINSQVLQSSNSYFAQLRANQLASEVSHFRLGETDVDENHPPFISGESARNIQGQHIETYILRQIINNLILHPDPNILSFKTRVAVAYNFLGLLVHEDAFWFLLREMFEGNETLSARSQSIRLIQKVVYILAFSTHIHPYPIYSRYQDLCRFLIESSLKDEKWIDLKDLVADCIMSLGTIGSEGLLEIGPIIVKTLLPSALEDSAPLESSCSEDAHEHKSGSQQAARQILGSLSWSVNVLVSKKGQAVFENESIGKWIDAMPTDDFSHEAHLMLIDILEPVITVSSTLREKLEIGNWLDEDGFLAELTANNSRSRMMRYLREAPGYTCTLKSLLRICKASTLLLYAKNASDEGFFVRVFETNEPIRAKKELKAEHLKEEHLPARIRQRMADSLFFSSIDVTEASKLDVFFSGSHHKWIMGGAVNTGELEKVRYYVVLGYQNLPPTRNLQNTTYYYWLKCESLLRDILPSIYSKYVESSTAWNALIQSLSPIHPLRLSSTPHEPINSRRLILRHAMASADTGDLLRRSVRMASEPVYNLQDVRIRINTLASKLKDWVDRALDDNPDRAKKHLQRESEEWPISIPRGPVNWHEEITFCSLPMTLLEFIAFESLCNALSYYKQRIEVFIDFLQVPSHKLASSQIGNYQKLLVKMTIVNDIHPEMENATDIGTGRHACLTAATAVGGLYTSERVSDQWVSLTQLPASIVPEELTNTLYDYLT